MAATTLQRVRDIAASQIGYTEAPVNRTKYGEWFGWNGVAWCRIFLEWVFAQAGGQDHLYGKTASVWVTADRFRAHGRYFTAPRVGDLAVFDGYSHIELVIGIPDDYTVETVGGNTSAGVGSINNGGQVARRVRNRSLIMGYCRPAYDYTAALFNVLTVDGDLGPLTITALQRVLNRALGGVDLDVDGDLGPKTYAALQRYLGRTVDTWNSLDVRALQTKIGAPVDGVWGALTTTRLQTYLNARRTYTVEVTP